MFGDFHAYSGILPLRMGKIAENDQIADQNAPISLWPNLFSGSCVDILHKNTLHAIKSLRHNELEA